MSNCAICYNDIKDNAKRFICRKCHLIICIPCFKETIERGLYVPTCCACRTPLNYDDIINATSKTYFKTQYINHLAEVQFKMLTEQTIQVLYPLIYKINRIQDLHITEIDLCAARLYKQEFNPRMETYPQKHFIYQHILLDFLDFLNSSNIIDSNENSIQNENNVSYGIICNELKRLQLLVPDEIFKEFLKEHWTIDECTVNIEYEIDSLTKNNNSNNKTVAKCESCNLGIIIEKDSKYICNVCKQKYCNKCLSKIENSEHECKQENIDSWEEIKKSTKLCPKCSSRIFRSEGCPQMFCTNCHTGFDWNTGKIINGNFHNPHRMEWLRNGGNAEINLCDDISAIINIGKINKANEKIEIPYYDELLRLLNYHNELVDEIRKYNHLYDKYNNINYYDLLRWYYRNNNNITLFSTINETKYKNEIKCNERNKFRYSTILSIITPINDIIHDGILTIINICKNSKNEDEDEQILKILSLNSNLNENENEFINTNIKIIHSDSTKPKYFKEIEQVFENMIFEIISFDNNLYSVEKVIDIKLPHFQFYAIPDIFTGYSIHLTNTGFETNYQLYFILNELCIEKQEWKINYENNKDEVEKYVNELNKKYPLNKINKKSQAADILQCKYLLEIYKSKLKIINIIYTSYLKETQKVILINGIRNDFNFNLNLNRAKRAVRRINRAQDLDVDFDFDFDFEIDE
jgi:hypothetical protein